MFTQGFRMSLKHILSAATLAVTAATAHATTTIGGIAFEDNAFADALYFSSGAYTVSGGSLASVLTDKDPGTYAFSFSQGAAVVLGFTDNAVFNLGGADLAVFELGIPDTITLTLGTQTRSYTSASTGFYAAGYSLNVVLVDFSDFGIVEGANLTYQTLGLSITNVSGTVPSLSLVGALHTSAVPEASALTLAFAGMGAVFALARRRKQG